jgi:hypothetical protein
VGDVGNHGGQVDVAVGGGLRDGRGVELGKGFVGIRGKGGERGVRVEFPLRQFGFVLGARGCAEGGVLEHLYFGRFLKSAEFAKIPEWFALLEATLYQFLGILFGTF